MLTVGPWPRENPGLWTYLLLFGILRVHIGRPQPRPLQRPVFVAQDPEGRHLAQPGPLEAPAGPAPREGKPPGGRRWRAPRPRDNRGHVRNSRSLPETTEGNRGTPETVGQYRPPRGGAGPARGGAPRPGDRFHTAGSCDLSRSRAVGGDANLRGGRQPRGRAVTCAGCRAPRSVLGLEWVLNSVSFRIGKMGVLIQPSKARCDD